MALFGKKKKAEPVASPAVPAVEEQDEILVAGGDADELDFDENDGGQSIDFDAIADELDNDNGESMIGTPLVDDTATAATAPDDFGSTADFGAGATALDADEDLDFDSVFDDGSPDAIAPDAIAPDAIPQAEENPFGAAPVAEAPASGGIAIEPVSDAPPLTYTPPLLTADAVATAGVPATRKSFPLPLLLGALGLLVALGAVGYLVTRGDSTPATPPVIATNPSLTTPATSPATAIVPATATGISPSTGISPATSPAVSGLGASVDGVPIAPGAFRSGAPALSGPRSTVPPALLKQLKDLWKQGAAAKQRGDIAGARAAWTKMLQLRPNHPGVQSAINKLPAA